MVLFGLFHGLAFLPVLLSIVGPAAYPRADCLARSHQITVRPADTDGVGVNGEQNHIEVGLITVFLCVVVLLLQVIVMLEGACSSVSFTVSALALVLFDVLHDYQKEN